MPLHKLMATSGGSGKVTIPKRFLRMDGLLTEDGDPEEHLVKFDRTATGHYEMRVVDESQLPGIDEPDPQLDQQANPSGRVVRTNGSND